MRCVGGHRGGFRYPHSLLKPAGPPCRCALRSAADRGGKRIDAAFAGELAAAAEMGFSELTIAGLLGHAVPGVTARYAHLAPDRALLAAADAVAKRIDAALIGEPAADVIEFDPQRARA